MGKSSSSSLKKKKRSKNSSKVRSRKISKTRSRKSRSKKLRLREDSLSYSSSSDDDSRSSFSVSSYSSEDDYIRRRARSRTRKDVKSGKKRARRRSSSRESGEDSRRVSKRKGSKRNDSSRGRKRNDQKKARRDASISSMSSGSRNCSTCRGGGSNSDDSEFERHRGRSERKVSVKRNMDEVKSRTKMDGDRWVNASSSGPRGEGSDDHWGEEKVMGENNTRRLRSVITVTKEENQGRELVNDEYKEEIVYDNDDDYPSCRSNDSNDGGSKKESGYISNFTSEKKRQVEVDEGAVIPINRTTKLAETGKDGEGQYDGSNPCCKGVEVNDPVKQNKNKVPGATEGPDEDDLESVLRRRALENLRKFRGVLQTNGKGSASQKDSSDNEVKQTSTIKVESVRNKSTKENVRAVDATELVEQISMPPERRDSTCSSRRDEQGLFQNDGGNESGSAMQDVTCPGCPPQQVAVADNPQEKVNAVTVSVTNKPKLAASALRLNSSDSQTTLKQAPALRKTPNENLVTESSLDKISARDAQVITRNSRKDGEEVNNNICGSAIIEPPCLESPSEGIISDKQQDGAKESSQYEQKTMSVMRGGEMVQVSYKVYIPKKAPALARRQLKR